MRRRARLPSLPQALACLLASALAWLSAPATAADLPRGAVLYDAHCLSCHGAAETPSNPTSLNARNLGPVLRDGIANARSGMLFLGDLLSASDIDDIAAFLGNAPAAIDLGAQARDEEGAVRSVWVRAGRENLERLVLGVQGDFVRVGGSCGERVQANTACSVDIAFRPRSLGALQGALLVAHDGLATPARIALAGTGAPAVRGAFGLSADRVAFGAAVLLQAAPLQRLEVQNVGSAALEWASPRIEGPQADEFNVSPGTCAFSAALVPGARCVLDIGFRPRQAGPRAATLNLRSADGRASVAVPLSGSGQARPAGRLVLDVPGLDFGLQRIGSPSLPREVVASNQGTAALNWLSQTTPVGFLLEGDCGSRALAVGEQCRLVLRFAPAALGAISGELLIVTDGELDRTRLPLLGEGVRAASQLSWGAPGSALSVGPSPVGRTRTADAVQLLNPGPDSITLLELRIDGLHAAEFAVDSRSSCVTGLQLAAGATCTVVVEALPRAQGLREARLTVRATGEAPRVLALSAEGQAVPAAAPLSSNLGGGGCTIGQRQPAFDPVWPLLVLAALGVLVARWREGRRRGRRSPWL